MENKKLICLKVENEQLDALEDLIMTKLTPKEAHELKGKVMPLWQALVASYQKEDLTKDIVKLAQMNDKLNEMLAEMKERFKLLLGYATAKFSGVAADLILNPEPIEIPCTEKGKRLNFMVSLHNVLAIESEGRVKRIYLKEPIVPKEGGKAHRIIETNNNKLGFVPLLRKLQVNRQHLFRVSKSFAINIFHYTFSESQAFNLINRSESEIYDRISKIEIDKMFDPITYHKQLWEIDYLYKYREKFAINEEKIDEIRRYIDSLDVTK